MGDLQNKLISQTYDALIQTGTDGPIDGTLRPLQDGSGNELPIEVSTTNVNFTGTVTGGEITNDVATNTSIFKVWSGTQAQYDAIVTPDANTLYYIVE